LCRSSGQGRDSGGALARSLGSLAHPLSVEGMLAAPIAVNCQ
jgi:hypothetical protein